MSLAYSPRLLCGWAKPACLFLLLTMHAAAWATQPAPAPVAVTSFSSLLQVLFGLGLVLAAIGGTAWLLRRLAPGQVAASGALRVVGGVAVGPKERVVLVDVGDTRLVLGVAPGRVATLHQMPRPAEETPAPRQETPGEAFYLRFKDLLNKKGGA